MSKIANSYLLVICILIVFPFTLRAGKFFTDRHSLWGGGIFGFSKWKSDGYYSKTFLATPHIRYFPFKYFFFGARFQWSGNEEVWHQAKINSDNYGFGLDLGGAFAQKKLIIPYFYAGIQFDIYILDYYSPIANPQRLSEALVSQEEKTYGRTLPLAIGLIMPVVEIIAIQTQVSTQIKWYDLEDRPSYILSFSIGISAIGKKVAISGLSNLGTINF